MRSFFLYLAPRTAELAFVGHFWRKYFIVQRVCGELLMALQPLMRTPRDSRPPVFNLLKDKASMWVKEPQTFESATFNLSPH